MQFDISAAFGIPRTSIAIDTYINKAKELPCVKSIYVQIDGDIINIITLVEKLSNDVIRSIAEIEMLVIDAHSYYHFNFDILSGSIGKGIKRQFNLVYPKNANDRRTQKKG